MGLAQANRQRLEGAVAPGESTLIPKRYFDRRRHALQQTRMTKQLLTWNTEPAAEIEIRASRPTSSILLIIEARKRLRPIRISFPSRRRESCQTRRAMLAALREAEFDNWQSSGGDYLDSMHQPVG